MSLMHEISGQLINIASDGTLHTVWHDVTSTGHLLAQTIEGPGIGERTQEAWSNFVDSGQIWAFIVGLGFGYWFRYMTGG